MKIRLIGLGKMGANLALNLIDHHHEVIAYDVDIKQREAMKDTKVVVVDSIEALLERTQEEKIVVWLLIPNQFVDQTILACEPFLKKKDILIDGGNSNFNASIKRYQMLKEKEIGFIDLGTSGGIQGARHGACLMAGGEDEVIQYVEPVFLDVATKNGYTHTGKPGSGHFIKMVHNGIEYGMMQAIAEGLDLIEHSPFEVDYAKITNMWNHGSIIESSLMKNTHDAFLKDAKLNDITGRIDDSGEGMWMIEEALKYQVSIPVITQSLFARYKSRDTKAFGQKAVAAMRKEFGGHAVYKK